MCSISDIRRNDLPTDGVSSGRQHIGPKATLTLLGGDARQFSVAEALIKADYNVQIMGLGEENEQGGAVFEKHGLPTGTRLCGNLSHALEGTDAVLLPYPATKDGVSISCPLDAGHHILLEDISRAVLTRPSVRVFGGRLPQAFTAPLREKGCLVTDYEDSEAFLIKNARLTAEGAVMTAMELMDTALLNAKVAVVGYGRIGQLLARLLQGLGARVTVVARRRESLAAAEACGLTPCATGELIRLCEGYRVIFNTVPARLLEKEFLTMMPCRTLIIELASAPGGLDPEGAREATRRCGLQIVRAPSLPGRYAPIDAGLAIADCVLSVLEAPQNSSVEEVIL